MANVKISVRFRRKTGHHMIVNTLLKILIYLLFNKMSCTLFNGLHLVHFS